MRSGGLRGAQGLERGALVAAQAAAAGGDAGAGGGGGGAGALPPGLKVRRAGALVTRHSAKTLPVGPVTHVPPAPFPAPPSPPGLPRLPSLGGGRLCAQPAGRQGRREQVRAGAGLGWVACGDEAWGGGVAGATGAWEGPGRLQPRVALSRCRRAAGHHVPASPRPRRGLAAPPHHGGCCLTRSSCRVVSCRARVVCNRRRSGLLVGREGLPVGEDRYCGRGPGRRRRRGRRGSGQEGALRPRTQGRSARAQLLSLRPPCAGTHPSPSRPSQPRLAPLLRHQFWAGREWDYVFDVEASGGRAPSERGVQPRAGSPNSRPPPHGAPGHPPPPPRSPTAATGPGGRAHS